MLNVLSMSRVSKDKMEKAMRVQGAAQRIAVMVSFPYCPKTISLREHVGNDNVSVWLDSGAFTAFRKGIKISLYDYIQYIKQNQPERYFALDSITDQEETRSNYLCMLESGLSPIPVFHRHDTIDLLDLYVSSGADMIGLGCRAPFANDQERMEWLDKVFARYPKMKFHCLGLNGGEIVERYSFYSCDSATWEIEVDRR